MTSTSALLWTRSNELGPVRLFVWPAPRKGMPVRPDQPEAVAHGHDRVVQRRVHGLKPGTRYTYLFSAPYRKTEIASGRHLLDRAGARARTRPSASRSAATPTAPAIRAPGSRPTTSSRSTAGWRPSATTSTSTSATRSTRTARSAASRPRSRSRRSGPSTSENLALRAPAQPPRAAPASTATGTTTSSSTTSRCPSTARRVYRAGVDRVHRLRARLATRRRTASTAAFRWGKHLELFFLDERSFRSAKVRAICDNDLAPTAPQAVRNAFAALVPSLGDPVPQACLDALRGPVADDARRAPVRGVHEGDQGVDRDLEGDRQRGADPAVLRAARTTAGRAIAAEREQLLRFLQANVKNVLFLTTDTHANFVNEVRLQHVRAPAGRSAPGSGRSSPARWRRTPRTGRSTRRSASAGMGSAIDGALLQAGSAARRRHGLRERGRLQLRRGRGHRATITVTPKDASGALVREETGGACGPFTFTRALSAVRGAP